MTVIESRERDLGDGFVVRRVLPAIARQMVGPFIFVDHFGPMQLGAGKGLDVRPHPHINLATVTYLFEGEILHRDSLGSEQLIRPGAVNWMTAGRGIVHSERSPSEARKSGPRMHGVQLWVALPTAREGDAPSFDHYSANDIPETGLDGARLRIITGDAYGVRSPVKTVSPMFYIEARLEEGARLKPPDGYAERAAYVAEGEIAHEDQRYGPGKMIVSPSEIVAVRASRVMLLGGDRLDGERHIYWNFVSSSAERIEKAKDDWRNGRFPKVPGDETEFIPLPNK